MRRSTFVSDVVSNDGYPEVYLTKACHSLRQFIARNSQRAKAYPSRGAGRRYQPHAQ